MRSPLTGLIFLLLLVCIQQLPFAKAGDALQMPRASQSLLLDIVSIDKRLLVVGERGHILYSDDHGSNWTQAAVPVREMLTAVHFPSAMLGWAVGHDGLVLNTIDGGEHWLLQRNGLAEQDKLNRDNLKNLLSQHDALHERIRAAAESQLESETLLEEMEASALDIEDARALLDEPPYAPPLLDVFFNDDKRGAAIGAFNTLLLTTDGGVSWQQSSALLDNPDGFHLNGVSGDANGKLWIVGEGGTIFRSMDYGASWLAVESPYAGSWFGVDYNASIDRLLVFGLRGNVFYSDDEGDSWQQSVVPDDRSLAGGRFINKDDAMLVGSVGTVLVSEDAGARFESRTLGIRVNLSAISCVAGRAVAVGQGGVHVMACGGTGNE